MKINPAFPPSRRTEPTRRAERDIYQAVEASPIPGRALYEVKVTRHAAQVDLVLWAEAVATFGVGLKGGPYEIHDGELCLVTDQGRTPKPGLLAKVWDSSMEISRFIERKLGRGMYIIPVVGLTDTEENEAIRDMAARRSVRCCLGRTTGSTGWSTWPAAIPSGTGPPRRASSRRCSPSCRSWLRLPPRRHPRW